MIPAHENYRSASAAVSHTRTLTFLKPLVNGPYFDLEAIWNEHCLYEFGERAVAKTMGTMVQEPYVNHIPTITGGIGRERLTNFYRNHFVHSNPPDTSLELVSRTVGVDRVIDEFVFKCTHDRVVDWLFVIPLFFFRESGWLWLTVRAVSLAFRRRASPSRCPSHPLSIFAVTGSSMSTLRGIKRRFSDSWVYFQRLILPLLALSRKITPC